MDIPQLIVTCTSCSARNVVTISFREGSSAICPFCNTLIFSYVPVKGNIYVLSNPRMPKIYKVGYSLRSVEERVKELNAATGVPDEFVVEEYFCSTDPKNHEAMIHQALAPFRIKNKEFFECSLSHIIATIAGICGDFRSLHPENTLKKTNKDEAFASELLHILNLVGSACEFPRVWEAIWEKINLSARSLGYSELDVKAVFRAYSGSYFREITTVDILKILKKRE